MIDYDKPNGAWDLGQVRIRDVCETMIAAATVARQHIIERILISLQREGATVEEMRDCMHTLTDIWDDCKSDGENCHYPNSKVQRMLNIDEHGKPK